MAKEQSLAAQKTPDIFGLPAKRGRPASGTAMTNAQRQKQFRSRRRLMLVGERISNTIKVLAEQFDLSEADITRELLRFALCNKNWKRTGFPSVPKDD